MAVSPGKSPEDTKQLLDEKEKIKASGMLFDHLFIRHWDAWADGTRNHVFAYDLATGKARDLMLAMDADCPTKPFGDSTDFAVSPDGLTLVFSAKDMGAELSAEAWSTNYDLFTVPTDGAAAPKRTGTSTGSPLSARARSIACLAAASSSLRVLSAIAATGAGRVETAA
jgi:dipeptidyl aminopeptidase/acylaminoacyl peptidase